MDKTLLRFLLLVAVCLGLSTWMCQAKPKHHRHHHLRSLLRHKAEKQVTEGKIKSKNADKPRRKTEEDVSGSGMVHANEAEGGTKGELEESKRESSNGEVTDSYHKKRSKKKKLHDEVEKDKGSLRELLDSSIENLAKAGKAIQAILDATGKTKVSQSCPGTCPDVCAPGCGSTCCNMPPGEPVAPAAPMVYPPQYPQPQYQYPTQPQYVPMGYAPLPLFPQQPRTQSCPQQCSSIPCPDSCPPSCCSVQQPQYQQPSGGMMAAPQFLVIPPAKPPRRNNTQPTQPPSCPSPCSQACAPACSPNCCTAPMGMPMPMPMPYQPPPPPPPQPIVQVMSSIPQLPQMQQLACAQACQPAVPGGCAAPAQCPPQCCATDRR